MKRPTIETGADPMLALKVYMIAAGLNTKTLADKVGMKAPTMSRKLNGKNEFKLNEVKAIAEALDLSPEEILTIFLG